jgi:hypothetical protein
MASEVLQKLKEAKELFNARPVPEGTILEPRYIIGPGGKCQKVYKDRAGKIVREDIDPTDR